MYEYAATLAKTPLHPTGVVDGDTVHLDLDLGFYEHRVDQPYRLLRINAPEMKIVDPTTGKKTLDNPLGEAAKVALETYLVGKSLMAHTQKSDSFGRFLTELYADNTNVSDWMVTNGHAVYKTY
jgi:endonuclease YncB( thermonuclease family)